MPLEPPSTNTAALRDGRLLSGGRYSALLPLPARSPELDPAEMLWRELRQRYLSRRVYRTAAALERALSRASCALASQPERVSRLCNFIWLHNVCNKRGRRLRTS